MEKANRLIPNIYGYAVCLVSIIVTLMAVSMIITSLFKFADPIHANNNHYGPIDSYDSYEAFKINYYTGSGVHEGAPQGGPATYTPSEDSLKAAYESSRSNYIASVRSEATTSMTEGIIMLLIAAGLFFSHWRWLNKLTQA